MATEDVRYWRIRMKCYGRPFEKLVWEKDRIGIWCGEDGSSAYVIKRFSEIKSADWVFVYFDNALHLARVDGEIHDHQEFDWRSLPFRARRITEKKSFQLARLPDCFLLLRSAGFDNVFEPKQAKKQIEILANSRDENEALEVIDNFSFSEWLDISGDKSWEAICTGYLILHEGFVPTGLLVGETLPVFDIVGRDKRDGTCILAQCKKDPSSAKIAPSFVEGIKHYPRCRAFYFAYGGCPDSPPT